MAKMIMRLFFAFMLLAGVAISACDREGPAERAGESLDEAAEETGEAMEDAGDRMK